MLPNFAVNKNNYESNRMSKVWGGRKPGAK